MGVGGFPGPATRTLLPGRPSAWSIADSLPSSSGPWLQAKRRRQKTPQGNIQATIQLAGRSFLLPPPQQHAIRGYLLPSPRTAPSVILVLPMAGSPIQKR
jgi:hypothetical protein